MAGGYVKWYTLEKSMKFPPKTKKQLPDDQAIPLNFTSGYIPKRSESRILKRYLHICVHYSIIHNSQEVEAAQMPTRR